MLRCRLCYLTSKKIRYLKFGIVAVVSTLCLCVALNKFRTSDRYLCSKSEAVAKPMSQMQRLPSSEFYIKMLVSKSRGELFDPKINITGWETQLQVAVKLLWSFLDLCEKHSIQVMLHGRTLLGSYRHHGFIPWDDRLELLLNGAEKKKLLRVLEGHPDCHLKDVSSSKVSIESSACRNVSKSGCSFLIDVAFYQVQDAWVVQMSTDLHYPLRHTFPLHKRPFMGRWIWSPRDALHFLAYSYAPSDSCMTTANKNAAKDTISCMKVARSYPFVFRFPDFAPWCQGVLETLRHPDGEIAYTVPVGEPMDAINAELGTRQAM